MPEGYGTHKDYIDLIKADVSARQESMRVAFKKAFASFIQKREVEVILFSTPPFMPNDTVFLEK